MDKRTERELNYPHVQIGIIFVIAFLLYIFILIFQ